MGPQKLSGCLRFVERFDVAVPEEFQNPKFHLFRLALAPVCLSLTPVCLRHADIMEHGSILRVCHKICSGDSAWSPWAAVPRDQAPLPDSIPDALCKLLGNSMLCCACLHMEYGC